MDDEFNRNDKKETMLRDLCDSFSEFEQYAERIGDPTLLNDCISSLSESIMVERGESWGAPCYYVTFGKKTMVIYDNIFGAAKKGAERGRGNEFINVMEKGNNNNQKIFDRETKYSPDQVISLEKIINIVLGNAGR